MSRPFRGVSSDCMPGKQMTLRALLAEYSELPEFEGLELNFVNQKGRWDSAPLHIAIHRQRPKEAEILLEAGADPNAPGEYGERPLQIAVRRQRFDIVEMLLRAGARCDLKDDNGTDAWWDAESVGAKQRLQEMEREIVQKINERDR